MRIRIQAMARLALLLQLLLLASTGKTYAQVSVLDTRISVHYTELPLEKILQDLSAKTHVKFSYSPLRIPVALKLSYQADNNTLEQVMKDICRKTGIHFELVNGYIVLTPRDENEQSLPADKHALYTISGTVTDSASKELLIGAAVYNKEPAVGATTNNYGFFSLSLPEGNYTLQVSYLGYSTVTVNLDLTENLTKNISLKLSPVLMKEIVINSVNQANQVFNSLAAQTNVDPAVVQRQPSAMGETDMLKSLDNLPGISFQSDGSSFFSVRGGNHDQNLILLDEAPIYNPSHLLGLFTPIIPEAIKHTEVYRADFPVQFGGRLSSVIDIRARDGNMKKFSGSASISPVSTRFSVEGPLKRDVSSYFVSFRVSTFGLLVKAANPTIQNFYFTDFTTKFNIRLSQRDRLYLTLFAGKDAFINKPGAIRNGLEWVNSAATLRWSHVYGSRLFSNTTLFASKYNYSLYTDYDHKISWNSDITSTCLKSEFTWYVSPSHTLKYGINAAGYFFNPGNYKSSVAALDTMRVSQANSGEFVLFAGDEIEPVPWLKFNAGFRLSGWNDYGEAYIIVYDQNYKPVSYRKYDKGVKYFSRTFLEPRISVSFRLGMYTSLKASYNRTIQNVNQISNSISPFNSLEVWLPSGPNIKPQRADISDLCLAESWPERSVELTVDVYYKRLYNQIGYQYHAEMFLNPYLEGELRQGKGLARGFEILILKTQGQFTGQLGYGFTRSTLTIAGLNEGRSYPSHQDKPVDLSLLVDYRVKPRWSLNLNVLYQSGMPLSTPTGFYDYRGTQVPVYARQNNDRLPDYKRVDIASSWRLNRRERPFEHYFTLTVYNFFNTRNYAFLNFNKIQGEDGKFYVPSDKLNSPMQMITYRYIYSIIPSFTYSLRF